MYNDHMQHDKLTNLVKEFALSFGDFTLSSGAKSPYFVDMSKVTNHGEGLDVITLEFSRMIGDADAIGGPVLGAAPLVAGTILAHRRDHFGMAKPLRGFLVRKEPKDGEYIEGFLKKGDKVVVVEDVVTTGTQTFNAIKHVEAAGGRVVGVLAVLDRLAGAKGKLADYHFRALLTIEDLGISANLTAP
jgi:orotate phosphoribosyltransferase